MKVTAYSAKILDKWTNRKRFEHAIEILHFIEKNGDELTLRERFDMFAYLSTFTKSIFVKYLWANQNEKFKELTKEDINEFLDDWNIASTAPSMSKIYKKLGPLMPSVGFDIKNQNKYSNSGGTEKNSSFWTIRQWFEYVIVILKMIEINDKNLTLKERFNMYAHLSTVSTEIFPRYFIENPKVHKEIELQDMREFIDDWNKLKTAPSMANIYSKLGPFTPITIKFEDRIIRESILDAIAY